MLILVYSLSCFNFEFDYCLSSAVFSLWPYSRRSIQINLIITTMLIICYSFKWSFRSCHQWSILFCITTRQEKMCTNRERSGWRKNLLFVNWVNRPFRYRSVSLRLIRRLIKPLEWCWSGNGWRAGSKVGCHFVGYCKTAVGGTLYVEFPWQPKELVPEWKRELGGGEEEDSKKKKRKTKNKKENKNKVMSRLIKQHISSFIQSAANTNKCSWIAPAQTPRRDRVPCKYLWS